VHVCGYMVDIYGGYPNSTLLLGNLTLFWNLEIFLQENRGYLIHLSFFSGGHLSTHCFRYLRHLCVFFSTFFYEYFFIAPYIFSATKLWERYQQELWAFIWWMKNLSSMFLVFTPSIGVKYILMNLNGKHVFTPTPV
jgi:hypothetical protein